MQHSDNEMEASKLSNSIQNIRCHHCAGPLSNRMETSHWNVSPLIRDSFSMIGSAVGGTTSAFYGFNLVMPIVQRRIKGPMWLHFLIGAPPVIVFSSACAGLAGGAVPAAAQLVSSSYHAAYPPPSKDEYIQKGSLHGGCVSDPLTRGGDGEGGASVFAALPPDHPTRKIECISPLEPCNEDCPRSEPISLQCLALL
ncbi:hypothetical protein ACSQ67_010717 [Phaseolus vulgaris]